MFASLLLTIAVASNLPGLAASGALDPRMPDDMTRAFGTTNWPVCLHEIGTVACIVTAGAAVVLLLLARRARGGLHMVRGAIGIFVLLAAANALGHALPNWFDFTVRATPAATFDWYFNHVNGHRAFAAAMIAAVGYTLLLWPPRRRWFQSPAASPVAGK